MRPKKTGRAWIEIDKEALLQNVRVLRSLLPSRCNLMPAVKANAYGHGAAEVSKILSDAGVDAFCVACVSEGVELRKNKIGGTILILGYTDPDDFTLLYRYRLTQTVVDPEYAEKLCAFGKPLHVHIAVDTGMHRLGVRSEDIDGIVKIFGYKDLIIDGIFTHLCTDDTDMWPDVDYTSKQITSFFDVVDNIKARGISCPKIHLQSSYGLLNYPEVISDYARIGIALYGLLSTKSDTEGCGLDLRPVLSLKARIASVRDLTAGEAAGYGLAFTAGRKTKIAALSIGYADGVPRELSCGKGCVLIGGKRCPVAGRICMDQMLVDVTDAPGASQGAAAVIIGTSGNESVSAAELAEKAGTISNEILSRLGARLERIVV